jgi:hypothetical protein
MTYMIPPALPEVWKPVTESDLKKLEYDTANPAHLDISDDHHFEPPSKQVSQEMHINRGIPQVKKFICRVLRCVNTAVLTIALLRKRGAKAGIEEPEDFPGIL